MTPAEYIDLHAAALEDLGDEGFEVADRALKAALALTGHTYESPLTRADHLIIKRAALVILASFSDGLPEVHK